MTRDDAVSVRPLWTRHVALELKNGGADVDAALAEAGLDWRSLNKAEGWIPFVHHAELMEIAARELRDECYGIGLAQRVDVRDGDMLAYLGIASETVDALLFHLGGGAHFPARLSGRSHADEGPHGIQKSGAGAP